MNPENPVQCFKFCKYDDREIFCKSPCCFRIIHASDALHVLHMQYTRWDPT